MFLTHFFGFVVLGEGAEWDWIGKGIFRDLVYAAKTSPSSSEIGVDPPFLVIIPSSSFPSSVYLSVVIATSSRIPSVKGSQRLTIWIIHRLRDSNYSSSLSTARDSLPLSPSSLVSTHFSDLSTHSPQSLQSLTNSLPSLRISFSVVFTTTRQSEMEFLLLEDQLHPLPSSEWWRVVCRCCDGALSDDDGFVCSLPSSMSSSFFLFSSLSLFYVTVFPLSSHSFRTQDFITRLVSFLHGLTSRFVDCLASSFLYKCPFPRLPSTTVVPPILFLSLHPWMERPLSTLLMFPSPTWTPLGLHSSSCLLHNFIQLQSFPPSERPFTARIT